jgi:hypothetical protein
MTIALLVLTANASAADPTELARSELDDLARASLQVDSLVALDGAATCVADQASTLRGLLGVSAVAIQDLGAAAERGDLAHVRHELRKIEVAADRAREIRADVLACVGEVAFLPGFSRLDLRVAQADPRDETDADYFLAVRDPRAYWLI